MVEDSKVYFGSFWFDLLGGGGGVGGVGHDSNQTLYLKSCPEELPQIAAFCIFLTNL